MADTAQPLTTRFPIIDPKTGVATKYFIEWAQQFAGNALPVDGIIAGPGISVTPGPTVSLDAGIDLLTDVDTSTTPPALNQKLGWDGSLWVPQTVSGGGGGNWWFDPPLAADFSLVSGDASNLTLADDTDVGLMIDAGPNGTAERMAYKTLTDKTLDWDLVVRLDGFSASQNYAKWGIAIRDSVSGSLIDFIVTNNIGVSINRMNSFTSYNGTSVQFNMTTGTPFNWFRISHSGGNYDFQVSPDGKQWKTVLSESDTAFLTNRADQVGFIGAANLIGVMFTCGRFSLTGPGV
jgi:hypothetical protein